jgi:hypothetical protein
MTMLKKVLFIGLYIVIHFLVLSDIRTGLFQYQIRGVESNFASADKELIISRIDTRIIDFIRTDDTRKTPHVITYKIPFGFFFLIGMTGLIVTTASRGKFVALILSHLTVLLIGSLVFYLSINVNTWLLAINDLLTRYFIPLISIGVVAYAVLEKKN